MSNERFCHPTNLQFLRANVFLIAACKKLQTYCIDYSKLNSYNKILITTLNLIVALTIVLMSHAKCDSDVTMNPPFKRVNRVTQKTLRLQHGCACSQ